MFLICLILAFLFPPLSVAIHTGSVSQFILNLILTFLGWIPGLIHALCMLFFTKRI
jgi:uncharacterized membrane protein YqaE (UPF0057 family)